MSVAEDGLSVVRKGNLVAVYAQTERRVKVELPVSLRGKGLQITNACTGKDLTAQAEVVQDAVTMAVPAQEPIFVRAAR